MGTDIWGYLEYYKQEELDKNPNREHSIRFFGEVNIWRDYNLFAVLADVRNDARGIIGFEPKGLPKTMSWNVMDKATLYIADEMDSAIGSCTKKNAESWGSNYTDETKDRVWNPDWHSGSWMNEKELAITIRKYKQHTKIEAPIEITALLATMKFLKKSGYVPRFVFWFDN